VLMSLVSGTNWELGVVLFILGNIGYGTSVVIYYAFIPEIATADERDGLSTKGWAFGYLGGGVALAVQLAVYLAHESLGITEGNAAQIAFLLSGIWWAAFTTIPLRRLRNHQPAHGPEHGGSVLTGGFRELRSTFRAARAYPLTLAFLGTYLIYTDGIATVANVSAQYGSEELNFENTVLISTILIVQFVAFIGGWLHGRVARRYGAKRTIMMSLGVWVVVIGFAYFVQAGQALQFYALAVGIDTYRAVSSLKGCRNDIVAVDEFLRHRSRLGRLASEPAISHDIAAFGPSQLPETLLEHRAAVLILRIILRQRHQHADAPHPLRLRARGERPKN